MKKNSNIKKILSEASNIEKRLKKINEAYVFDDMEGYGEEMPQQAPQQIPNGESEEEKAMHATEIIQHEPIIGKIREIAIDGLKKYADHPTSSIYAYFKDVFLSSDKLLTDGKSK